MRAAVGRRSVDRPAVAMARRRRRCLATEVDGPPKVIAANWLCGISGSSASPVIIDDLRVKVLSRRLPLNDWVISYLGLGSAQGFATST
jgi:hypothetical protein